MIRFVDVEDIGPVRLPNAWEQCRIKRIPDKKNRQIAWLAFGAGLTVQQFKKLPQATREALWQAFRTLTSPHNVPRSSTPPEPAYRKGQHLSAEEKVELGRKLLRMKASLPRGHFGPWVAEKSGLAKSMVHDCMRMAKATGGAPVAVSEAERMAA